MKLPWIPLLLLGCLLLGCGSLEGNLRQMSVSELLDLLEKGTWREKEAAEEELSRRGREETGRQLIHSWEQSSDARFRARLVRLLNEWGVFVLERRKREELLSLMETWRQDLESHLMPIRTETPGWAGEAGRDLRSGLGLILLMTERELDKQIQEFRSQFVQETHYAITVLSQDDPQLAITALAGLIRMLQTEIQTQRGVLQEEPQSGSRETF